MVKEGTKALMLRVSAETAEQLKREAEAEGRSVNNLLTFYIRKMLDERANERKTS